MSTSDDKPRMTLEEKRAFLADPVVCNSIRKVARSRGVPAQDVDDVLGSVVAEAMVANLPAERSEALLVVNGIALHVSARRMGKEKSRRTEPFVEVATEDQAATPVPLTHDDPDRGRKVEELLRAARAEYPRTDEYLAAKLGGETAAQVAARRGVSAGHVRKEWSQIGIFMRTRGRDVGLVSVGVAVLVIAAIRMSDWGRGHDGSRPQDWSDLATIHHEAPGVENDPAALRDRARRACRDAAWEACVADLDAAKALDPAGETAELSQLRVDATENLVRRDPFGDFAPPDAPEDYVKPGLH